MIITTEDRASDQVRRLEWKTQDQQLRNLAVEGAGISAWEAEVLVGVVKDVYFHEPGNRPLRSGQTRFECVAIRLWLEGLEPVEIARRINHTLKAVERYIHTFCRVVYLRRKTFHEYQIALTVGISTGSVKSYLEIYEGHRAKPEFQRRFEEIDLIGASHFQAEDEKRGYLCSRPQPAAGLGGSHETANGLPTGHLHAPAP